MTIHQKRKLRRKITGEDFTPSELVNEMLDKLPDKVWKDPTKTFCDPAAGDGNFLEEVLCRKLLYNVYSQERRDPLQALKTIYGVELMDDNVDVMKERLLNRLFELKPRLKKFEKEAKKVVDENIICHDALTWDFENWCEKEVK